MLANKSALLKMGNRYTCESFTRDRKQSRSPDDDAKAREIIASAWHLLKAASDRVVTLIEEMRQWQTDYASPSEVSVGFCPWSLDCAYKAAVATVRLGVASSMENAADFAAKKAVCVDLLTRASVEWKLAGQSILAPCATGSCLTHLTIVGVYLDALSVREEELLRGHY